MENQAGLTAIDYAVIAAYIIGIVLLGSWAGRRQKSTEDFLLAGRSMRWWPIAISLFAAFFSSISYIAIPGEAFNYGTTMYLSMFFLALPLPVALLFFLKLFYRLRLWTAYEYLERRFQVGLRICGSAVFLVTRCVYLGVALYATALLLEPAVGWPLWVSILLIGIAGTVYAGIGGLKGVIWTDVAQFVILVGGVLAIIVFILCKLPNGAADILQVTKATNHGFNVGWSSGFWDFNFRQRITVWAWLIGVLPNCIAPATDQVNLQLCLACKNYRSLAMSMIGSSIGGLPVVFIFYIAGLSLLAYTRILGPGTPLAEIPQGDQAYTWFITHIMPVGLRGLIIAGLMSAVMSTAVSVINSLATVTIKDIYQRVVSPDRGERHYLAAAKLLTVAWGMAAIAIGCLIACLCSAYEVTLLEISNICLGIFSGILLGLFSLGLLNPRANSFGAWCGIFGGIGVSCFVTYRYFLTIPVSERISFLWIGVLAPFSVFVIGSIFCLCRPREERRPELVIWKNPLLKNPQIASKK